MIISYLGNLIFPLEAILESQIISVLVEIVIIIFFITKYVIQC